ncbi:ankyrin repeat domain-containing protein [Kurthia huakuii]|uniref:ankyrin repeat domain-containing protein n=1 Tax=Kurthia huakuii TaxID=1421019 RepID=UPI000497BAC9|nr:ankyrin repeat domain-containing protein [Kurthia huakuii]MBM7700683.1 ankyrin repeat protein [Kurthia huakuii]
MKKRNKLAMLALSIGVALGYKKKKEGPEPTWFRSIQEQEIKEVKRYIARGQNVHVTNRRGRSALMMATYNHHVELAEILIEAGANVNQQDDLKNTPYLYAAAEGYVDILELMNGKINPHITNRYGGNGLIPACERGAVETVAWILTHTASDIDHINNLGWTALLEAIILGDGSKNYQQIIKLLLEAGANANIADKDGVTPLEHAEKRGYSEISRLLIQHLNRL